MFVTAVEWCRVGQSLPPGSCDDGPSGLVADQLKGGVLGGDLCGSTMNRCAIRCRTFWVQNVFKASWLSRFLCSELMLLLFPPAVATVKAALSGRTSTSATRPSCYFPSYHCTSTENLLWLLAALLVVLPVVVVAVGVNGLPQPP